MDAKSDLCCAKTSGCDVSAAFLCMYGCVEGFEQEHEIKLPEDIASMMTA